MVNKKIDTSEKPTIDAKIPKLETGESMKITNLNGNYILSELNNGGLDELSSNYVDKATYDFAKIKHIYNSVIEQDSNSFVTTSEEISSLAKNTQNDINKIIKINGIIRYYINKEDLIGRVVEIIENNVNVNYSLNYNYIPKNKKDIKIFEEYKKLIEKFNSDIEIEQFIRNNLLKTYTEGNNIFYLMGDSKNGYGIINYPLDIAEVTSMKIDNENVISFKITELKQRLNSIKSKYGKIKSNKLIDIKTLIEQEILRDYPSEVYEAYKTRDNYALLNPKKTGLVRINNLNGLYGVSPIFKCLSSLLTLETIDKSDREILNARSKKIYYQKTRKELMGKDYDKPSAGVNQVGYSHTSLLECMKNNTIIYTSMPYVEDLDILEPTTEIIDVNTKKAYKLSVLEALGISFASSDGSTSITTVRMMYDELIKMINRITKQLETIIHKYYQLITEEYGYPVEFAPYISIQDTKLLDYDTKLKITDLLFSKIGLSYQTTLETLGMNYKEEKDRREKENKEDTDTIFIPHSNSYTSNSNDLLNKNNSNNNDKNSNGSEKNDNENQRESNKQRQDVLK